MFRLTIPVNRIENLSRSEDHDDNYDDELMIIVNVNVIEFES